MSESVPQAIIEAVEILRASGLVIDDWTVLGSSSRVVLALRPCHWVARVAQLDALTRLARELAVAAHVASVGGPVAPPAASPGPYLGATVAVTLWQPLTALGQLTEAAVGNAYVELRRSLDSFAGALPDFREEIRAASRQAAEASLPGVSQADAVFLRDTLASSESLLSPFSWNSVALHGDAHSGNVINTTDGPRWFDFESACAGPVEWDLSALSECPSGIEHNRDLLRTLVTLRRAAVVLWCAMKPNPSAAESEAFSHHLAALRAGTMEM
ncbi:MAG TPA: phosphotransferase [Polyangiaceae bacterium]|jgi:Ser/Thr protein kinase RdoA (MazF antagonist)|nr:phosphotransferase [Polyangiaceae bacterium]